MKSLRSHWLWIGYTVIVILMNGRTLPVVHSWSILQGTLAMDMISINVGHCRKFWKTWGLGTKEIAESEKIDQASVATNMAALLNDVRFRDGSDLVDLNITHFAAVGMHQGGVLKSVLCLTTDDREQTRKRTALVTACTKYVFELVQESHKKEPLPFPLVFPCPGALAYLNTEGEILDIERVDTIPEILAL
jgi:hypothetical protein